jgi:plasmid stabilization system protein ParE
LKRQVFWSEAALGELTKSIAYIAKRNPAAARKMRADISQAARQLSVRPIGRPGRVLGTFDRSVTNRPYIIAYAVHPLPDGAEAIVVLHVVHAARDWPEGQWPKS